MAGKRPHKSKESNPEARKPPKPVGRPRKCFSREQLKQIDEYAEAQCKDTTIAEALGIDPMTFKRHFEARTCQKRALGKVTVMRKQFEGCQQNGPGGVTERIWWGKQHLEQKDRQDVTSNDGAIVVPVINYIGRRSGVGEEGASAPPLVKRLSP